LNLVIQSFGGESEYKRAILAIWSFYAVLKNPVVSSQVIFFTDAPTYFKKYLADLPIRFVLLTPEKISQMKGEVNFLHRLKIALIEEAFSLTQSDLLYADSDTFFTDDPARLMRRVSAQTSFMHVCEYRFDSLLKMDLPAGAKFHAFVKCISENKFPMPDGSQLVVTTDQYSWNAGVMMLHAAHVKLLPQVYALTDHFYLSTQNHASEQYAFSVALQNNSNIEACDEVVYHYWYRVKKQIIDLFLNKKMTKTWGELLEGDKKRMVSEWVEILPRYLNNHVLLLRDKAIQAFHENRYSEGYRFAIRAMLKNPFALSFIKDVFYHSKRWLIRAV